MIVLREHSIKTVRALDRLRLYEPRAGTLGGAAPPGAVDQGSFQVLDGRTLAFYGLGGDLWIAVDGKRCPVTEGMRSEAERTGRAVRLMIHCPDGELELAYTSPITEEDEEQMFLGSVAEADLDLGLWVHETLQDPRRLAHLARTLSARQI